jgi:hypothetical protein
VLVLPGVSETTRICKTPSAWPRSTCGHWSRPSHRYGSPLCHVRGRPAAADEDSPAVTKTLTKRLRIVFLALPMTAPPACTQPKSPRHSIASRLITRSEIVAKESAKRQVLESARTSSPSGTLGEKSRGGKAPPQHFAPIAMADDASLCGKGPLVRRLVGSVFGGAPDSRAANDKRTRICSEP